MMAGAAWCLRMPCQCVGTTFVNHVRNAVAREKSRQKTCGSIQARQHCAFSSKTLRRPPGLRVLSLFDGIAAAKVAMDNTGVALSQYSCSEIDRPALHVVNARHNKVTHLGDIRTIDAEVVRSLAPDVVIGGSPCQDLSRANAAGKGLQGVKSSLFFEFLRVAELARQHNPDCVLVLENVIPRNPADRDEITRLLGVTPLRLRAEHVSACHRDRYFWTNLRVQHLVPPSTMPLYSDALEGGATPIKRSRLGKAYCIVASASTFNLVMDCAEKARPLLPIEEERLLGFPDDYTAVPILSSSARHRLLGNSFSIPVVEQLLGQLRPLSLAETFSEFRNELDTLQLRHPGSPEAALFCPRCEAANCSCG